MAEKEKIIYVYDSFTFDEPKLMGRLFVNVIKGGESYSFEYDQEWLFSVSYPVIVKNNWESLAVKYGISRGKIDDMRPAFSACYD